MLSAADWIGTDIVLAGAGHAHVAVLRAFGMKPLAGTRLTLITRQAETPYSGMLPGVISGAYTHEDMHIDTAPLARFAGARLIRDEITGVDTARRLVICRDRGPVPYDLLSLDIGSTPNTAAVPGAAEHAIAVKPIDGFLARLEPEIVKLTQMATPASVAVIGAGAGGVELMFALEKRLRAERAKAGRDPARLSFHLISGAADILPGFAAGARARILAALAARGIAVRTGARVSQVEAGSLTLESGLRIAADAAFWTAQAAAAPWLRQTGLELDPAGFIKVGADLRALGSDTVFAAGDTACFTPRALPKSGVYAVRAGPVLAENLRRAAAGQKLTRFKPQRQAMYLLSTADGSAVGSRNGLVLEGQWIWRWKDWIDRRFMRRFNQLPEMPGAAEPGRQAAPDTPAALGMRCGGCGAKVGATILTSALSSLMPHDRAEIISGLGAPDDAAVIDLGGDDLTLQTVDYFRAPIDDPWLFGRIAANHALSDIFAMGGEAVSALAIATLPYGLPVKVEQDLRALMEGANRALAESGCALAGGHTSEGAELALGFAVTGKVRRGRLLRKGGLAPGDALILTKPLGSGVILAAHMRAKAPAPALFAAIDVMLASNRIAAGILSDHAATAMTDVTGFGLIGHLAEMLKASAAGAELDLGELPVITNAAELIAAGVASTMQPENFRARHLIANPAEAAQHPLFALLFDPQTSGGLLAGVPQQHAQSCLKALRSGSCPQAVIVGRVTAGGDADAPLRIIL